MKQKETDFIKKARSLMNTRVVLIVLIMVALVLEGFGLVRYYFANQLSFSKWAIPIYILMVTLGVILIIIIMHRGRKAMKQLNQVTADNNRLEKELDVARGIQMSMIPKTFPPYPERSDLDMYAKIYSAKEVGGDLYDFFVDNNRLYFCIGDVSGKGVPAALVMAVTRSLFRTEAGREKSPARIVTAMNRSMSEMNEKTMFVTFFCGVLDLAQGHLRYCNAGHNAPVLLTTSVDKLPVVSNVPLGVDSGFRFVEQETDLLYDDALFLYTDGVPEAENKSLEQFGDARMMTALRKRGSAKDHIENVQKAVDAFVDGAPRSDDLTMLFIHYLSERNSDMLERHLILHNDVQQIPQLADFIGVIASEIDLDQSLAMSMNLALEEAVTNVILYAYPAGADGIVDIEAVYSEASIKFIVTDNGIAFDPTKVPEANVNAGLEERGVGGLGIFLVRSLMDSVSYERTEGYNILTMIKTL